MPRNPLDVLAQQIVAMCAVERVAGRRPARRWCGAPTRTASCRAPSSRACSTCSPAATRPTSSPSCARASSGTASPTVLHGARRARGRWPSPTPAPSPTAGCSACSCRRLRPRRRAGRGDGLRGARRPDVPARRVDLAHRARSPATACSSRPRRASRAQIPFWKGEGVGRPVELGRAIGAFVRETGALPDGRAVDAAARRDHHLDERAARNLLALPRDQRAATGVLPTDRTIVVERFRDEIGDWRLCILTPVRRRACTPRGRSRSAPGCASELGAETQALWSRRRHRAAPARRRRAAAGRPRRARSRGASRSWSSRELGGSAAVRRPLPRERRPRAAASRAAGPGQRTPLWQQRLKAQSLLAGGRGASASFPIVLETYRECLQDVLRPAGAARAAARGIAAPRARAGRGRDADGSPFAASLLFDYVAQYMYEGDTPPAERRAQALSLDREPAARAARPGRAARPARPRRPGRGRSRLIRRRAPARGRRRPARPAAAARRPRPPAEIDDARGHAAELRCAPAPRRPACASPARSA